MPVAQPAGRQPATPTRPRILVVEDDEGFGRLLERVLTRASYVVRIERDGLDALAAIFGYRFDVILLDIMVPRIDGLTMLRYLRGSRLGTPVLVVSARDGVADRAAALSEGADDYLAKPFPVSELLDRVAVLCRRGVPADDEDDQDTW